MSFNCVQVIELLDYGLDSDTVGILPIRSYTLYDAAKYDGTVTLTFEAVYTTTANGGNETISLVDSSLGTHYADITTSASQTALRASTSVTGSPTGTLCLELSGTTAERDVIVDSARLVIKQVGATKTAVYIPLFSNEHDASGTDLSYTDSVQGTTYNQSSYFYYTQWKYTAANWQGLWNDASGGVLACVISSSASAGTGYARLYDGTTQIAEVSKGGTAPGYQVATFNPTTALTDGNSFYVQIKGSSSSRSGRLFKAGMYLLINTSGTAKGETYYRVAGYAAGTTEEVTVEQRVQLNHSDFSNPKLYVEAFGFEDGTKTDNAELLDAGTNDSGTSGSMVTNSHLDLPQTVPTLTRSSECTKPTSGNRLLYVHQPGGASVYSWEYGGARVVIGWTSSAGTQRYGYVTTETTSSVTATTSVSHATQQGAMTSEAVSAVATTSSVAHPTWQGAVTTEAVTSSTGNASVDHAHTGQVTTESASSVTASASVSHATAQGAVTTESASTVTATPAVAHVTAQGAQTTEATSTVTATPTVIAVKQGAVTTEATSLVTAASSVSHTTAQGASTSEATSAVTATTSVTHPTAQGAVTSEATSAVTTTPSVAHPTAQGAATTEATSSVTASVTVSHPTAQGAFTDEATSLVTATPSVEGEAVKQGAVTTEATTLVTASASVDHTHQGASTSEAESAVTATVTVAHVTAQGALTDEATSAVTASASVDHAHQGALTDEATSAVTAASSVAHVTAQGAVTTEGTSLVTAAPSVSGGAVQGAVTTEATSDVTATSSVAHTTAQGAVTDEATSAVTAAPYCDHVKWSEVSSEATSDVTLAPSVYHYQSGALTDEATSDVVAAREVTHAVGQGAATDEATSDVTASPSVAHHQTGALTSEAESAVTATTSVDHPTAQGALTSESESAVKAWPQSVSGYKQGAVTSEATSAVKTRPCLSCVFMPTGPTPDSELDYGGFVKAVGDSYVWQTLDEDDAVYATRGANVATYWYGNRLSFSIADVIPSGANIVSSTLTAEWHNSTEDSDGPVFELGVEENGSVIGTPTQDTTGQTGDEVVTHVPTLSAEQLRSATFYARIRFKRTD